MRNAPEQGAASNAASEAGNTDANANGQGTMGGMLGWLGSRTSVGGASTPPHKRTAFQPRIWVAVFAAIAIVMVGSLLRVTLLYRSTTAQADVLRGELASVISEKASLTRERDYMTTHTYIERAARIEYGFIYPNDIRFVAALNEPEDNRYYYTDPSDEYYPYGLPLDDAGQVVAAFSTMDGAAYEE
jgi:cell division protein FtsB